MNVIIRWTGLILLLLGTALGGAYIDRRYTFADWERRYAEYQRQIQGDLSEKEKRMQALNTQLGLARSQLVSQGEIDQKYQALIKQQDGEFERFRRENALVPRSLSDSRFTLQQRIQTGTEKAKQEFPASQPIEDSTQPAPPPVISYEYTDKEGRIKLTDPNIWVEGDEDLQLTQSFRVEGTILTQVDGSLMTERIRLFEVSPRREGQTPYLDLAEAQMVDARFTYANAPLQETSRSSLRWGLVWMATVGSSFQSESLLRFGISTSIARLGPVGFAGGVSSDFRSLKGSGGDVFLTYTPSLRGRALGMSLGGGLHFPFSGSKRTLPEFTLTFDVY